MMLYFNLSSRIWRTLKTQSKTGCMPKNWKLLCEQFQKVLFQTMLVRVFTSRHLIVISVLSFWMKWIWEKKTSLCFQRFMSGFYQINVTVSRPTEFNLEQNLHTSGKFCVQCRCPSGFGPPWIWTPVPNPLVDMDPRESIFTSRFGPPFANLDPPTKVIILFFRTPGVVNE